MVDDQPDMLEVATEWFRTLGCDAPAPPERRPNIESPRAYVLFSNLMVPGTPDGAWYEWY